MLAFSIEVREHGSATAALATARSAYGFMKSSWPLWLVLLFLSVSTLASTGSLAPTAFFSLSLFLLSPSLCLTEHGFSILFGLFSLTGLED